MQRSFRIIMTVALGALAVTAAEAKPIAFADGTTTMVEANDNMREAQAFHAPTYWWSLGPGVMRLVGDDRRRTRDFHYLQANVLLQRWNLPAAQGNLFAFAGAGTARLADAGAPTRRETLWRYGAQGDYETRRVYGSFKVDGYRGPGFSHRIDTLQLGLAPYAHDYEDLATWFLVQGRRYSGGILAADARGGRIEQTLLLRLFQGPWWAELGVNRERRLQAMLMFNF
jgi:hypothetical protein